MDSDGENQRQLTFGPGLKMYPCVTPDNRYIVFASDMGGSMAIWRMEMDGSNQVQLSPANGYFYRPQCSSDGEWVVYQSLSGDGCTLWKISIEGGQPIQLTDYYSAAPALSPDGTQIACFLGNQQGSDLGLVAIGGGTPQRVVHLPSDEAIYLWRWIPREGLTCLMDDERKPPNVYRFSLDGENAEQLTFFSDRQRVSYFDWFRDGRLVISRTSDVRDVVLISEPGRS
jgi:Tol biopolymer transport system component